MSIGTSVSLSSDSPTDVDTNLSVFALRAADVDRSVYSVAGLTLPLMRTLTISHTDKKEGGVRSLIRIDMTDVDTLLVPGSMAVYMVIDRDASTAISNTEVKESVYQLIDFIIEGGAGAVLDKILNREV